MIVFSVRVRFGVCVGAFRLVFFSTHSNCIIVIVSFENTHTYSERLVLTKRNRETKTTQNKESDEYIFIKIKISLRLCLSTK